MPSCSVNKHSYYKALAHRNEPNILLEWWQTANVPSALGLSSAPDEGAVLCRVWQRASPGGSLCCSIPINPSCPEGHRKGFIKVLEPTSWSNFELPAGARERSRALLWCSVYHLILLGGKLLQAEPVTAFMWLSTSSHIKNNYIGVWFFTWPYLTPLLHLPFLMMRHLLFRCFTALLLLH